MANLILLLSALVSCTPSAVRTQGDTAHSIATALNAAAPFALEESRAAAVAAGEAEYRACRDGGTEAACTVRAHAALDAQRARWRAVFVAWDALAAAHTLWRAEILRCRSLDGGACAPSVETVSEVLRAASAWRCALRDVGRGDLDPLPGAFACGDGGAL